MNPKQETSLKLAAKASNFGHHVLNMEVMIQDNAGIVQVEL